MQNYTYLISLSNRRSIGRASYRLPIEVAAVISLKAQEEA
jgi:hypothetical protein